MLALGSALTLTACSEDAPADSSAAASSSSSATSSTGAGGSSATSGGGGGAATSGGGGEASSTTGGGGDASGQGGSGGAEAGLATALLGEWRPTQFADSGNPPEPVPEGSPYWIFEANGDWKMGCGTPPGGTWTLDLSAPPPAIAVIHVLIGGSSQVDWYVTKLDTGELVFVEGGDFFYFERSVCP